MNWEAIGAVGQMLGSIAVFVTLSYLAVQIRQSTQAQHTDTYARALDRLAVMQARMSQTGEFADILVKGMSDHRQLTQRERVQFTWAFYEMFGAFEFMYHQSRAESLPDAVWNRWAETLLWWLSFPGVQAWWDARPTPFTPDFTRFVEEKRRNTPPEAERQRRWVRFLAGS
jgi:hypothetical protein